MSFLLFNLVSKLFFQLQLCHFLRGLSLRVHLQNAKRLEVSDYTVIKSDLFDKIDKRYDMILSNPPYIESKVIDGLMPEVRDYEPRLALDGDADGLKFYRAIIENAESYLMYQVCLPNLLIYQT